MILNSRKEKKEKFNKLLLLTSERKIIMKETLKKISQIIFSILIIGILLVNIAVFDIEITRSFLIFLILLIIFIGLLICYHHRIISKKFMWTILGIFFLLGIVARIFLICNLKFLLVSDFEFYYNHAHQIINNVSKMDEYISYNGYAYMFSKVISILFIIFGENINTVLVFNLICQIITTILFYKIISIKADKTISALLSIFYFLLPNVIFSNLLVSAETFFMLLFILTIYLFLKFISKPIITKKNILKFILLGIMISITNNIRPVMTIFIISLIIYYILTFKKIKEFLSLGVIIITYVISNLIFNIYIENGIGQETRSGALGWSIYFGSNYETCGSWTEEDSNYVFNEILNNPKNGNKELVIESFKRYEKLGVIKSTELIGCKYTRLWTDNNSTLSFLTSVTTEDYQINLNSYNKPLEDISRIVIVLLLISCIANTFYDIKNKNNSNLFLQIFSIGYILSNLIVCLNGRYNLPLYPLLIICSSNYICSKFVPNLISEIKKLPKKLDSKFKTLLIIPAYNEEDNIEETVKRIDGKYDYIIINDGSTDKTSYICQKNNYKHINLIKNLGIGGAVQTGYKYALNNNYDIAIQFDADGQHDVECIEDLIKPIKDGKAHFVVGSRFVGNSSEFKSTKMRQLGINIISKTIKKLSNTTIKDVTSGFRAANKEIIKRFADNYPSEYPEPISNFELIKDGYIVSEVAVKMHERKGGKSSIRSWKNVYYMFNVILSILILNMRGDK